MHLLIIPLLAFNLHMRNKNKRSKLLHSLAEDGLANSIINSITSQGALREYQTKESQSIK